MAIIAEGVTSNGTRYIIRDDCIAPRGSARERQIIEDQRRAAYDILKGWAECHGMQEDGHGNDERRGA